MVKNKKPRIHHNGQRRSNSANQPREDLSRNEWDDAVHIQGSVEGPISPVNYSGTQINVWGLPGGRWTEELMHAADPNRNPNFGYMTEQMLDVRISIRKVSFENIRTSLV